MSEIQASSVGTILRTNDGGASWGQQQLSGFDRELFAVDFVDSQIGWTSGMFQFIGGDDRRSLTTMRYTIDGASSWRTADFETQQDHVLVNDLDFIDSNTGWLVGGIGKIWRSDDGGLSWSKQFPGESSDFLAVDFVDGNNGWAVGGTISHTSNGGLTWETQERTSPGTTFMGVDFVNETSGWAVGPTNQIMHTTDGGDNWTTQPHTSTAPSFYDVVFPTPSDGWIVGASGTILHTNDAGNSWVLQSSGITKHLNAVDFISATEGWAAGESGTILHTSNGGLTWHPQISGTDRTLYDIVAVVPEPASSVLAVVGCALVLVRRRLAPLAKSQRELR